MMNPAMMGGQRPPMNDLLSAEQLPQAPASAPMPQPGRGQLGGILMRWYEDTFAEIDSPESFEEFATEGGFQSAEEAAMAYRQYLSELEFYRQTGLPQYVERALQEWSQSIGGRGTMPGGAGPGQMAPAPVTGPMPGGTMGGMMGR